MDFFSGVWDWFKGSSLTSSLAKTALLGYASRLLGNSTSPTSSGDNTIVDTGVRLQLDPDTENKIPVLYGEAYFGGYITDAQLSSDYKKMTYCLTLAELTGNKLSTNAATSYSWQGVYINNNRVVFKSDGYTVDYTLDPSGNQDISMRDLVKIYFYCDQTGVQPQGSSGTTPSPFTTMPGWSSTTHSMENLCYAIVEVTYNRDAGVNSLPNLTFHVTSTCTLVGDVLYDYMTNDVYGAGIPSSEIDTSSLIALNTYCTTGFTYTNKNGQSSTSQIKVNGLVDTKTEVLTNMQALAEAGSSWMSYDIHSGTWKVVINKAANSVASFTDSNMVGEISISGTSLTQLNNVADVKYQNTDILDKTDFVKISIPEDDLFANEPESSIQINLPFTNKQVVAAKIGLQQLKQARIDKIINFKADYSYIMLNAGDVIDVTSTVYGFTNKLFRIITVTQIEGDLGEILLDFTALEYDADVYTYNITEYNVESDAGILGIGSIGKPNTPSVTKTEEANVPKIVVNAVVPSGIVDAVEYWITFDTGILNDTSRTYIKIGEYSNPNGSILTEDATVSYTYTGLQQSDFYVKVRGVNGVTTGPFSDPSGLITYKPTVVADTVSDNPVSIGGQLMGLGLLTLLNNLDKLFKGDSSAGGLFDKIFKTFEEVTGIDLVGEASGGDLVVKSDVNIYTDGSQISQGVSSLDFTSPLKAETQGDVIVKIKDGTNNKDILAWNAEAKEWQLVSGCVSCDFPPPVIPPTPCSLPITAKLPAGGSSWSGECAPASTVPYKGSYYLRFTIAPGTTNGSSNPSIPIYGDLKLGSGNVKLYGSDGNVEQTLSASQLKVHNNVLELPFAPRIPGKDYYILMDAGVVSSCGCANLALTTPEWAFTTSLTDLPAYDVMSNSATDPGFSAPSFANALKLTSSSPTGDSCSGTAITLNYSEPIKKGSGSVIVKNRTSGATVATLSISSATVTGSQAKWTTVSGLSPDSAYDVTVPKGLVVTNRQPTTQNLCDASKTFAPGPELASEAGSFGFSTGKDLALVDFDLCLKPSGNAEINSNIVLNFNKAVKVKESGAAWIYIYESGGGLHQKIDLNGTFQSRKYNSLTQTGGNSLSINPTKPFSGGQTYYLNIDNGAIVDADCDAPFGGISDATTVKWRTDGVIVTPPTSPTFGSVYLDFEFDRPVSPGIGKINVVSGSGALLTQIGINHPAIKLSTTPIH